MKLVVLLVAVLVLAAPASAAPRASVSKLETELVCQLCHETLDESTSPEAQQMKAEIRRRVAQGWTNQQILDEMVANYGPSVLSTPGDHGFDLLAWVLPIGGALVGVAALALVARLWTRPDPGPPAPGPALDPELERRIDAELARFDG